MQTPTQCIEGHIQDPLQNSENGVLRLTLALTLLIHTRPRFLLEVIL